MCTYLSLAFYSLIRLFNHLYAVRGLWFAHTFIFQLVLRYVYKVYS